MAKTIATILGAAFLLVGVLGFISPGLGGFHLSVVHNLVHIISGAVALYIGLKGTLASARLFCIIFGVVYGLLGVAGYVFGADGPHTVAGVPSHGTDPDLLRVIAGQLELAAMDHGLHVLLGLIFLIGGLLTRAYVRDTAR